MSPVSVPVARAQECLAHGQFEEAMFLLGKGDMLILPPGSSDLRRVHCAFASEDEVQVVTDHWRAQGTPTYDDFPSASHTTTGPFAPPGDPTIGAPLSPSRRDNLPGALG